MATPSVRRPSLTRRRVGRPCGREYMATSPVEASDVRAQRAVVALTTPSRGHNMSRPLEAGSTMDGPLGCPHAVEIPSMTAGTRRSVGEPLGVWLIGARGAVATTTIVGAIALRRGHTGAVGLVTESDPFRACGFAPLDALVFGGHDLLDTPLVKAAHALCRDAGPLAPELVRLVEDELAGSERHLRSAPALAPGRPPREFVRAVQR